MMLRAIESGALSMREWFERQRFFDASPIYKRKDPRYVRKLIRRRMIAIAKEYAPEILDGFIATVAAIALLTIIGLIMYMLTA